MKEFFPAFCISLSACLHSSKGRLWIVLIEVTKSNYANRIRTAAYNLGWNIEQERVDNKFIIKVIKC